MCFNVCVMYSQTEGGQLWDKEKVALQDRWLLKRDSVHMKISRTGQDKGDLLIQVTA